MDYKFHTIEKIKLKTYIELFLQLYTQGMAGESLSAWWAVAQYGTVKWPQEAGGLPAKMAQAEPRCLPDDGGKGRKKSKP